MAVIERRTGAGWEPYSLKEGAFPILLGADPKANVVLAPDSGAAPHQAAIVRSAAYSGFVLIDFAGENLLVNGLPVVRVKALRHLDVIRIGREELRLREFSLERMTKDSPHLGRSCLERHPIEVGDEVVVCRCGTATHRRCWAMLDYCGQSTCVYPVRNLLLRALNAEVRFTEVREGSPLAHRSFCPSGRARDKKPFEVGDQIVHCPRCKVPFHEKCWLALERCPTAGCDYPVRKMVDGVISPP